MQRQPVDVLTTLTDAGRLRIGDRASAILHHFTLEFVKVKRGGGASVKSTALVSVHDAVGRASLLFEGGELVAALFGVTHPQWTAVERLLSTTDELFYRRFKNGLNDSFPLEQKVFFAFCESMPQKAHFVTFTRAVNVRRDEKSVPFLRVVQRCELSPKVLNFYYKEMEMKKKKTQ